MNFYKDLFSKAQEKEKLSGFQVLKPISIKEFIKELTENEISIESIDKLFEKSCFMTIDSFFEKYYSKDTLKCQHYAPNGPEWFFICRDCCVSEEIYLCGTCFFQGDHIKNVHTFQMVENQAEKCCDCGNNNLMKKEGFCNHHSKVDEKNIRERLDKIPIYVKKDVHLFFRNLFLYLIFITSKMPTSLENTEADFTLLETQIQIISNWLILKSIQSSSLIHIIVEELSKRSLDTSIDDSNFQLYQHKPIPFEDIDRVTATKHKTPNSLQFSPLTYIFSIDSLLNLMLPLLGTLVDNHRVFKILMLEEYCTNHGHIYEARDELSVNICGYMMHYCLSQDLLKLFSTGYSKFNYMELVLQSNISIYFPKLLSFYRSIDNETERPENLILQNDIGFIPLIFKDIKVVKFFFSNKKLFDLFFKFSTELHKFTSPDVIDQGNSTTKFIAKLESTLVYSIKSIVDTIEEIKNESSSPTGAEGPDNQELLTSLDSIINKLFEQILLQISKLEKRKLFKRCDMMLPNQDFFYPFMFLDVPIHFPLYRFLSIFLLLTKKDPKTIIEQNKLSEESIIEMVTTILMFRLFYISYDSQVQEEIFEFCTDQTMTYDLHLLHISIGLLGTKKFLTVLVNCMSCVRNYKDSGFLKLVLATLIQAIQIRPMVIPDKKYILYHLLQGVYSKTMLSNDFHTFDNILLGSTEVEINEIHLPQIATHSPTEKYLLDESNWRFYDPYYPYFSLDAYGLLVENIKKSFSEYQLSIGLTKDCNPLPPQIDRIPDHLGDGVVQMFYDKSYFEFIFNIFIASIYPDYKNYESNFDLQPILKKCFVNPSELFGEFFYLLILSTRSFNQNSGTIKDKESFIQLLSNYFKDETDKSQFKFSDQNNFITNLLKVYIVNISSDDDKQQKSLSILDLLLIVSNDINNSKQDSLYLPQINYLAYIYETLVQFDSSIFKKELIEMEKAISTINHSSILFEDNIISIPPSTAVTKDSKLNEEFFDQKEIIDKENDEKLEEDDDKQNCNDSKICVICKNGDESLGRLYLMSYIDLSSVKIQSLIQDIKYNTSSESEYDPLYKEFLKSFTDEIKPGKIQFLPHNDDPASLFACYLFYRSPSTFVSSCHHSAHAQCLNQYNEQQHPQDEQNQYPPHFFKCPSCKNPCDLLIPLGNPNSSKQYKKDANQLFSNLCYFDFKEHMQPESKHSIDKYLWKFVLQNIEILELKSRKTNLYSDEYYYLLSEKQFQQDLETTANLFNVVNSAKFENEPILPIYDPTSFFIDSFASSSYSMFLSKDDDDQDAKILLKNGLSLHLFSIFIHYCIKENVVEKKDSMKIEIVTKLILEKYKQIFGGNDTKRILDEKTKQYLINQVHPYLRKLSILKYLIKKTKSTKTNKKTTISLNILSNFENCLKLNKFNSIEELFSKLITLESLKETIGYYLKKKSINSKLNNQIPQLYSIYPPPNKYDTLPKFIEIETLFLDVMKNNTKIGTCNQCKQIFKYKCLVCGEGICQTVQCESGPIYHQFKSKCQSYPIGFHQVIEQPLVQIVTSQHGTFDYVISKHLYKNIENDDNIYINDNESKVKPFDIGGQKKKTIGISIQDLIVSKNRLKKIHKDWINHNYSKMLKIRYKVNNKFIV